MIDRRTFRFGIAAAAAPSRGDWVDKARRAEALGYATFLVPDHLSNQLAPVLALLAAAQATSTLRIGSLVFDNDFRHPVVVAKEAATLDLLSDGRFELGLGAGWMRADYEQAGIPFLAPVVRVDRLQEAVQIIKGLFSERPLSFAGQHYTVTGLTGWPRPVQRPHPPLLVAGGGKRLLAIAAREADIVGLAPRARRDGQGFEMTEVTGEAIAQKVEWVRDVAGARFSELELNVLISMVLITEHRRQVAEQIAAVFKTTAEVVLETPYVLIGSADQIAETLLRRREQYGISYVVAPEGSMDSFAPVVARLAGS